MLPGENGLVEVAINDGSLGGCVDRTGRPGLRSPAELMSIAGVLFLEPPMDVTEVAKLLEGGVGQKVEGCPRRAAWCQASLAACACRRIT